MCARTKVREVRSSGSMEADESQAVMCETPEELRAEKLKKAGLEGVELRFVTASGKFSNKSTWRADLPPTVLSENTEFRYFCAGMVESEGNQLLRRPPVSITFKAYDEEGRMQMDVTNRQPYTGGFYFYENIRLDCMPWTLHLSARLKGEGLEVPPVFEHTHVIVTESGRRPAPPRPDEDEDECGQEQEDDGPQSRRKARPIPSCGPKDMTSARTLLKITGKKDIPLLIKKRKALRKNRWLLFEGIIAGQTRILFSRACLHRELFAFMSKSGGNGSNASAATKRRREGDLVALPMDGRAV